MSTRRRFTCVGVTPAESAESAPALSAWTGEAADCEAVRQFARDVDWGHDRLDDVEHAADAVLADLIDLHPEAASRLRVALVGSAERHNGSKPVTLLNIEEL